MTSRTEHSRSVPGRALDPDQAVRNGLVALEVLGKGHDVVQVVDVDEVAPSGEEVDGLAIQRPTLVEVGRLACLVQERVDALVARVSRVQASGVAPPTRLDLMDVAVGIHAAAPA